MISDLKEELKQYPEGKLICCHHGKFCKWYCSDGHRKTYISKKNRSLAEQLAAKKYKTSVLENYIQEKTALDFYLRHHSQNYLNSCKLLESPGYQELLSPYFQPLSQQLKKWMNEPYRHNMKYQENLIHKTASGHFVRSKSEALIDWFLYRNNVPFRYESALQLGEIVFFPDFTIRHPKTGEQYYWEHLGRMDDPFYVRNSYSKLQTYASYGIIPTINLILTFETVNFPLSTEIVEKIIEYYFL